MRDQKSSLFQTFRTCLVREFLLLGRKRSFWIYPCCLYFILLTLFPFGIGTDPLILRSIAVGVIWVSAVVAVMMTMMTVFQQDYQEGVLEVLLFSSLPLPLYGMIKVLVWWVRAIVPLIILTPFLGLSYGLDFEEGVLMGASLIPGTLGMSFIVALGGSLTLALRENGMILSLMVLPLMIPSLIFGASVMQDYWALRSTLPSFCILSGLLVFSVGLCPLGIARAIRLSLGR